MNPAMIERLKAVENQAEAMERGARSAYLKQQAQELGISLATLYRKLEAVSVKPTRKRRSDAGKTELKPEEAKLISAVLVEAMRRNGKRLMSVRQACAPTEKSRRRGLMGKPGKSSRPSALLSARWQDIDLTARLWHIPAADMKTKHPFTVLLSDWAVEILRELHTQTGDNIHLFPGIRPRRKPAPHPDHISIKFAHNAIRRLGYDGSTPGKSKHTMHGFRHLFTNISLTAGKDTLTTDLALGHISRAALQRAGFSSLHHYLTADSYRLQERRELAEWYSRRHRQAYEAAAQNTCNKT